MISIATTAFLKENQFIQFKLPDTVKLKAGEYEIVIVINAIPKNETKKRTLSFASHNYSLINTSSTFSRNDIYDDFGR